MESDSAIGGEFVESIGRLGLFLQLSESMTVSNSTHCHSSQKPRTQSVSDFRKRQLVQSVNYVTRSSATCSFSLALSPFQLFMNIDQILIDGHNLTHHSLCELPVKQRPQRPSKSLSVSWQRRGCQVTGPCWQPSFCL
jgi:hypothetical protein